MQNMPRAACEICCDTQHGNTGSPCLPLLSLMLEEDKLCWSVGAVVGVAMAGPLGVSCSFGDAHGGQMCLKIQMKVYRNASLPQLSESCFLKLPTEVPATGAVRNAFSFLGTQK